MTTPFERTRALVSTRELLQEMLETSLPQNVPSYFRRQATDCLSTTHVLQKLGLRTSQIQKSSAQSLHSPAEAERLMCKASSTKRCYQ
jgi:hypothetical protein